MLHDLWFYVALVETLGYGVIVATILRFTYIMRQVHKPKPGSLKERLTAMRE